MLERIRKADITSKTHLLDRGLFAADILRTLIDMDQPFIMPAVKNSGIKRAIAAYEALVNLGDLRRSLFKK